MDKRPIVGLLVNDLVGSYQYGHWIGLEEKARELGCDFVSFNGGEYLSTDVQKRMRNAAFTLATPDDIDAVVLLAPAVANTLSHDEIAEFVKGLAPLPVVVAGLEIPGIPTVLVDNAAGMDAAVEHVVGFHGRKRPLYLGGTSINPEAIERRNAFLGALARHGLPVDPELDTVGNFDFGQSRNIVLDRLDRGIAFDSVIAANDDMALAAIEALKERDIRIPEDVIVTGFDDIEDATFSTPSLTSVRQPVVEQGRQCMAMAMDRLAGKQVPLMTHQPARLVARGSCGCHSASIAEGRFDLPSSIVPLTMGSEESFLAIKDEFGPSEASVVESQEFAVFLKSLSNETTSLLKGISLVPFENLIRNHSHPEDDNDRWQLFLSRMRKGCIPMLPSRPEDMAEIEGLFHQLRLVAHERAVGESAYKSMKIERWTRQLHETGSHLITTFDVASLIETLARDLPSLQLNACHILLREPDDPEDHLRLILSYCQGVRYELPPEGKLFPHHGIIRDLVHMGKNRSTLAVEPLYFDNIPLGFALLELAPRRGILLDALRTQISTALMGARLATQVRARTTELENALQTVEKNQRQLVLSEKMASLGRLTAGIAHEMNTPLSAMRSSLEEVRRLVKEYVDSIGDSSVLPADHQEIAAEMTKAVEIAIRAGDKASGFVRSIKSQTRDMGAKDKQAFDCVKVVEEAILLLSHALRASQSEVDLRIRSRPVRVVGIADRLAQVVTNLVTNAIDAMESNGGGRVTVSVESVRGEIRLAVSDTGCGIPADSLTRIFDPLFTTKPVGKGTGLGLTIIHDIIHGDFGGKVEVESVVGEGTTFTICLPEAKES
jgi:signal transduction histidine kinase/DNA-binding LacI/PurR family transcriptional regulator